MKKTRLEPVNTGGSIFIGKDAGSNDNLSDNKNIAIGEMALVTNETGEKNLALGYKTLNINKGNKNVAIGNRAMQ